MGRLVISSACFGCGLGSTCSRGRGWAVVGGGGTGRVDRGGRFLACCACRGSFGSCTCCGYGYGSVNGRSIPAGCSRGYSTTILKDSCCFIGILEDC